VKVKKKLKNDAFNKFLLNQDDIRAPSYNLSKGTLSKTTENERLHAYESELIEYREAALRSVDMVHDRPPPRHARSSATVRTDTLARLAEKRSA
jgi:hypothetical protein